MRRGLAAFVAATVSVTQPIAAQAGDGPVAMGLEGRPGFWVPRELFLELERRYEDHPRLLEEGLELRSQVAGLEALARLRAETASIAEARLSYWRRYALEESGRRREADADARRAAEALREAGPGWYESPALWFGVGLLVAGVVFYLVQGRPGGRVAVVPSP